MMAEVDLLRSLPKTKRNVTARSSAKTIEHISKSKEYDQLYFDGPREYGYGGYYYDGRWQPVARDIVKHFNLKPGDKVLDVGCAKGFLVKDLLSIGIDAYGLDISKYALMNCETEVVGRLQLGTAESLPFPDSSFEAIISINTIHNLSREKCIKAIKEIERLAPGKGFIQVDSYNTEKQKEIFESWVLTADFYDDTKGWVELFKESNYTGDYFWTIMSEE